TQKFVHLKEEHVSGTVQRAQGMKLVTKMNYDHPDPAEHAGALKAEVLTVADPLATLAQDPTKNAKPEGASRERSRDAAVRHLSDAVRWLGGGFAGHTLDVKR